MCNGERSSSVDARGSFGMQTARVGNFIVHSVITSGSRSPLFCACGINCFIQVSASGSRSNICIFGDNRIAARRNSVERFWPQLGGGIHKKVGCEKFRRMLLI